MIKRLRIIVLSHTPTLLLLKQHIERDKQLQRKSSKFSLLFANERDQQLEKESSKLSLVKQLRHTPLTHVFIRKQLERERVSSGHQPLKYNKIISFKGIRQDKDRTLKSDRKKRTL